MDLSEEAWAKYCPDDSPKEENNINENRLDTSTYSANKTTNPKPTKPKFDIKAYPKFSGKRKDFQTFDRLFMAVLWLHGLSYLLKQSYVLPPPDSDEYKTYIADNQLLFDSIKYAIAEGFVFIKVKRFEGTRDGRKAYRYLYEYCEGQGLEDTKATRALEDSMTLELTKGGNYGMDAFPN